ncbi:MAG: DNA repair protein RecO [Deltaproteobacteria bacterium]|nr:DNA repair protein RecO [Candidatus Anaeroferrophillacea bacterium]
MITIADRGIILNKFAVRESDLLITLFTEHHGRLTVVGKGAKRSRRRFPGRLELLSLVRLTAAEGRRSNIPRLDECELLTPHTVIGERPQAFFAAGYFAEIVSRCCPDRLPNRGIFRLLAEVLVLLDRRVPARNLDCQLRLLEFQIIGHLGFAPLLHQCAGCHRELPAGAPPAFDPAAGGVICPACRPRHPRAFAVSPGALALLTRCRDLDRDLRAKLTFTPTVMEETARLCRTLLTWHTGREFKSLKFLASRGLLAAKTTATIGARAAAATVDPTATSATVDATATVPRQYAVAEVLPNSTNPNPQQGVRR